MHREIDLYSLDPDYVSSRALGHEQEGTPVRRTWADWGLIIIATLIFVCFAVQTRVPNMPLQVTWLAIFAALLIIVLLASIIALRRITDFN